MNNRILPDGYAKITHFTCGHCRKKHLLTDGYYYDYYLHVKLCESCAIEQINTDYRQKHKIDYDGVKSV